MKTPEKRGRPRQHGRVTFTRLPEEIHAQLKIKAKAERRTISNLIAVFVENALKQGGAAA
jgi:predicted HicB family RNase H-like nuclease